MASSPRPSPDRLRAMNPARANRCQRVCHRVFAFDLISKALGECIGEPVAHGQRQGGRQENLGASQSCLADVQSRAACTRRTRALRPEPAPVASARRRSDWCRLRRTDSNAWSTAPAPRSARNARLRSSPSIPRTPRKPLFLRPLRHLIVSRAVRAGPSQPRVVKRLVHLTSPVDQRHGRFGVVCEELAVDSC